MIEEPIDYSVSDFFSRWINPGTFLRSASLWNCRVGGSTPACTSPGRN